MPLSFASLLLHECLKRLTSLRQALRVQYETCTAGTVSRKIGAENGVHFMESNTVSCFSSDISSDICACVQTISDIQFKQADGISLFCRKVLFSFDELFHCLITSPERDPLLWELEAHLLSYGVRTLHQQKKAISLQSFREVSNYAQTFYVRKHSSNVR